MATSLSSGGCSSADRSGDANTVVSGGSGIVGSIAPARIAACTKAKDEGVELYVTSFGSGVSTSTRNILKACATDDDNYQHASSSADLAAFFNYIGQDVLNKSNYVSK